MFFEENGKRIYNNINLFQILELCAELERAYNDVSEAAERRGTALEGALKAQQFYHDALEVDAWLADKAAALAAADVARDRHRATQLLTRHKVTKEAKEFVTKTVTDLECYLGEHLTLLVS